MPKRIRIITCFNCRQYYHVKCTGVTHKIFNDIKKKGNDWTCEKCMKHKFPFYAIDTPELLNVFDYTKTKYQISKP